ncbi:hypothetical protein N9B28_03190 [bacterium]|nr:hypothetical protein [bacterium]
MNDSVQALSYGFALADMLWRALIPSKRVLNFGKRPQLGPAQNHSIRMLWYEDEKFARRIGRPAHD